MPEHEDTPSFRTLPTEAGDTPNLTKPTQDTPPNKSNLDTPIQDTPPSTWADEVDTMSEGEEEFFNNLPLNFKDRKPFKKTKIITRTKWINRKWKNGRAKTYSSTVLLAIP